MAITFRDDESYVAKPTLSPGAGGGSLTDPQPERCLALCRIQRDVLCFSVLPERSIRPTKTGKRTEGEQLKVSMSTKTLVLGERGSGGRG